MGVEMDKEKGVCPFTPKEKWEKNFIIVIFCCFERLRRKGKELGRSKRETRGKTFKVSGKIKLSCSGKRRRRCP